VGPTPCGGVPPGGLRPRTPASVSSVIAFFYYARVAREMWFHPVPDDVDATPARTPVALNAAVFICGLVVLVVGVYPQVFARPGELAAGG